MWYWCFFQNCIKQRYCSPNCDIWLFTSLFVLLLAYFRILIYMEDKKRNLTLRYFAIVVGALCSYLAYTCYTCNCNHSKTPTGLSVYKNITVF
ncbi:unnamed protein product [Nezara viridula]|uniref:Uncharacterized protein n=1 Tax=Nezara viridula TaxID=85310 RepID=A0A9P0MUK8_NEZVI|nr:unnamed protein product [Nezara viridula]